MAIMGLKRYPRTSAPDRLGGTIHSDGVYFAKSADSSLALPYCGHSEFRNVMP